MAEQPTTRYFALDDGDICTSCGKPSERDSQLCKDCTDKISGGLVDRAIDGLQEEKSIITSGMFTSRTDEWETPQYLFDELNEQFGFETDVCALPENAKCAKYFTPDQNGLLQEWSGVCWMNPPYGRQIGLWVEKAYKSAANGATVVCLLPSRTDTAWWHEYCMKGEIKFLRGRLKFGNSKNSAPFPSAVVIFKGPTDAVKEKAEVEG